MQLGDRAYWAFCIEYGEPGNERSTQAAGNKSKIDYKELLPPEEFDLFARLRDVRKAMADRENIPVYAILTNAQIAEIVQKRITTREGLSGIKGLQTKRVPMKTGTGSATNSGLTEAKIQHLAVPVPFSSGQAKRGGFINRSIHGCDFLVYRVFPGTLRLSRRSARRLREHAAVGGPVPAGRDRRNRTAAACHGGLCLEWHEDRG